MNGSAELIDKARTVLGDGSEIVAAGIFGLQDDMAAVASAGVLGGGVADMVSDNPVLTGVADGGSVHVARTAAAASQGLTVRMLVALSEVQIHILDWMTGSGPTKVLLSFERARTEVRIKKFGLSRRVTFRDTASGRMLALTGTTAFFSAESKGDRSVIHLLEPPH